MLHMQLTDVDTAKSLPDHNGKEALTALCG